MRRFVFAASVTVPFHAGNTPGVRLACKIDTTGSASTVAITICRIVRVMGALDALGRDGCGTSFCNFSRAIDTLGDVPIFSSTGRFMIEVHELTKHYQDVQKGKFTAVDKISFHAHAGTDLWPARTQRRW